MWHWGPAEFTELKLPENGWEKLYLWQGGSSMSRGKVAGLSADHTENGTNLEFYNLSSNEATA